MCIHVCIFVWVWEYVNLNSTLQSHTGHWIPWIWSYRYLWAIQQGCWEGNLGPPEEKQVFLMLSYLFNSVKRNLTKQFWSMGRHEKSPEDVGWRRRGQDGEEVSYSECGGGTAYNSNTTPSHCTWHLEWQMKQMPRSKVSLKVWSWLYLPACLNVPIRRSWISCLFLAGY